MASPLDLCVLSPTHSLRAEQPEMVDSHDDHRPLIELRPMVEVKKKLHYPDIKVVLRYLSIEKRRELAKKSPVLRTLNKKLPYNFKKVELSLFHVKKTRWEVKCDSLLWRFEYSKDDNVITIKMITPEGKCVDLAQNGPVNRISQYFFDRRGTFIHTLNILNYNAARFSNVHPITVNFLKAKYTKNYYKPGLFKEFKNTQFQTVEIENHTSRNNVLFEDLKTVKTGDLRIWTNAAGEDSILELKPENKFDCYEDASLDDERFQKFCEKLKRESQLGAAYSCILYSRNFDPAGFLAEMKNEFDGEERYLNGRKCVTTTTSNPSHEMNITCGNKVYFGELPRNKLVVRIMKKGSSKQLEETGRINRARFNVRALLIRFLSFLLISIKSHAMNHSSIVHCRLFLVPFVVYTTPPALGSIGIIVVMVSTWYTWGLAMLFYSKFSPFITRLASGIQNQYLSRVVWAVGIVPLFIVSSFIWALSMFVVQMAYYGLYVLVTTYLFT